MTSKIEGSPSSEVTWAGHLSATSGHASYSDRTVTWSGPLTTGMPVTITYGVTVTHAPCCGTAAHTGIYTDVTNDAVLTMGKGTSSRALLRSLPSAIPTQIPLGSPKS